MLQLLRWAATHKFNSSSNLSKHKLHINLKMGNNKANISHSFIQIRIHYDSFMSLFNAFNCKWATKPTQVTSNDESISEIKKPNAEDNNKRPKECGHELSALLAWLVLVVSCFTCCSSLIYSCQLCVKIKLKLQLKLFNSKTNLVMFIDCMICRFLARFLVRLLVQFMSTAMLTFMLLTANKIKGQKHTQLLAKYNGWSGSQETRRNKEVSKQLDQFSATKVQPQFEEGRPLSRGGR